MPLGTAGSGTSEPPLRLTAESVCDGGVGGDSSGSMAAAVPA